jgi:hypothetical protein
MRKCQSFNILTRTSIAILLFIGASMFLNSCQKEEDPTSQPTNYLVGYEKINDYSASFIKILLGTMENVYPGIDTLITDVKYGIDLYKVTYHTKFHGSMILASGLICVPSSDNDFPILSFQNGTNTFKMNAPTINPADPLYTLMEMMASHGYVVTIADYVGFGASSSILHPYYDKTSSNDAVINLIKAAHELLNQSDVKAGSNGKHFLMGYSQGGWATLCALNEANIHNNDSIQVVATSCGAGAYDIPAMSDYVLQQQLFPGPIYLPYYIYSRIDNGDLSESLSVFFKEPYASRIPGLFDGTNTNSEINEQLNDTISLLLTDDMLNNLDTGSNFEDLRNAMLSSSIEAWNTTSLLRFYHGTNDLNVPPFQSDMIYNKFRNIGLSDSQLSLIPIPGATHETGLIPWGVNTIMWFDSLNN